MAHQLHTKPRGARIARERHGEVQDFLNRLVDSLTRGDGANNATRWGVPALVVGADRVIAVTALAEVAAFYGHAKSEYNARGIQDTRADIVDEEWIGDRLVIVKVRWPWIDDRGHEIGAEASDYTLRRDDDGTLKIRAVLMRGIEGTGEDLPS